MKLSINLPPQISTSSFLDVDYKTFKTSGECYDLIQKIETDWNSVIGGRKQWASGRNCELTPKAKARIKAIQNYIHKTWPTDEYEEE